MSEVLFSKKDQHSFIHTYVATVMNEHNITSIAVLANSGEGVLDIFLCRRMMLSVIHKDQHFAFFEAFPFNQVLSINRSV